MDWTEGYVADTAYTNHYYPELAPPHLDLVALTAGVLPPDRSNGKFRYCELGCGNGLSTTLLAAANPKATFIGIDFMPIHVATARDLARQGGVTNVQFLEMSFADSVEKDFEPFDYVVAHGVYSWIAPANRMELVDFLRKFLAPGGLVYLSYNCLPGWLPISPIQKLVSEYASTVRGASTQRVRAGFDFATTLLAKGAHALGSQPQAKSQIEAAAKLPANYLAQEYLNEHWHPQYVTEVMRELAPAKLEFVASAAPIDNDLRILLSEDLAATVREQPTEDLRQLVKDIAVNTRFRRDLYARGARRLSGLDQRLQIANRHIALTRSAANVKYQAEYGGRQVSFDTPSARKTVDLLAAQGPSSLATIAAALEASGVKDPVKQATEIAMILIISNSAIAVSPNRADVSQVNHALCSHALEDGGGNALVSGWGTAVSMEPLEQAFLGAFASAGRHPEQVPERVHALAQRKGRAFSRQGKVLTEPGEVLTFLKEKLDVFVRERQTALAALGVQAKPGAV